MFSGAASSYKETVEDACKSALDAVSLLSDDLSFQKTELPKDNKVDTLPCVPIPTVEREGGGEPDSLDDLSDTLPSEDTQVALVTNLMKAQHGLKSIIDSASQSQSTSSNSTRKPLVSSEASITITSHSKNIARGDRSSSPPPIPPYNPDSPDRFLLSNKPEYQLEVKRQRHYYEDVELDQESSPPRIPRQPLKFGKKTTTTPTNEFKPNPSKAESPVDPLRANKGLPNSGLLV